jgi:hypothetical protein
VIRLLDVRNRKTVYPRRILASHFQDAPGIPSRRESRHDSRDGHWPFRDAPDLLAPGVGFSAVQVLAGAANTVSKDVASIGDAANSFGR